MAGRAPQVHAPTYSEEDRYDKALVYSVPERPPETSERRRPEVVGQKPEEFAVRSLHHPHLRITCPHPTEYKPVRGADVYSEDLGVQATLFGEPPQKCVGVLGKIRLELEISRLREGILV